MTMTPDLLLALTAYAFVSSITPGPNNTMLLASGLNFGLRRTVPHALGVSLGFAVMILAIGLGAGALFAAFPALYTVLRYLGALFLLYLAWRIARSGFTAEGKAATRPFNFLEAAAFQWINPKAWVMALSAVTTYTPQRDFLVNVVVVTIVFSGINLPCIAAWAGLGGALRQFLTRATHMKVFNAVMALLLVLSLYPIFFGSPELGLPGHSGPE